MNYLSAFVLIIIFTLNLIYCKSIKGPILQNIGKIFLLYWLLNIFIGVVIFKSERLWNWNSLYYLLLCVSMFSISYNHNRQIKRTPLIIYSDRIIDGKTIKLLLFTTLVCGLGYVYFELTSNGFDLSVLTSEEGLMESGYYFTDGRYGGNTEIQAPLIGQILLTINYSGFCLAGYLYKLGFVKKRYCFLQFIPMILSTLSTTAKTLLISGLLLWITGYIVAGFVADHNSSITRKLQIKRIIWPVIILFIFFYASFVIRYQDNDTVEILNRLFVYAFGHVPCYDDWYGKFEANLFGFSFGQQSMQFIFGSQMPRGLINEYVVPYLQTSYGWTNVNTMFAYVLMDFGYIGSLLFFYIWGRISSACHSLITINGSALCHAVLALTIYEILYSFLISAMKYRSIVGAFVLFGCFIHLLKKQK